MKKWIFLSHSGADKEFALNFATRIEQVFGNELEVFCTSRPEFRLGLGPSGVEPGGEVGMKYASDEQMDPEFVRRYLRENLAESQLHLLLATGNSMIRGNDWVSYEMQMEAEEHIVPVVVLIGGTQSIFRGIDDPHSSFSERRAPNQNELIERSKWLLAGNFAPTLVLDSGGWRTLVMHTIPQYLGLTPSQPQLVEDFHLPW
jgi:hypothetical protein